MAGQNEALKEFVESAKEFRAVCGFQPAIGKKDFRKWFWQWAVDVILDNTVAIFDAEVDKIRVFISPAAQFGNVHSIFVSCRIGEALVYGLCKLLKIPALIYIDDTIIVARESRLRWYMEAADIIYRKFGIWMSEEKDESHLMTELLQVLGIGFLRPKELKTGEKRMEVVPMPSKTDKAMKKLNKLRDDFCEGKCSPEEIAKMDAKNRFGSTPKD